MKHKLIIMYILLNIILCVTNSNSQSFNYFKDENNKTCGSIYIDSYKNLLISREENNENIAAIRINYYYFYYGYTWAHIIDDKIYLLYNNELCALDRKFSKITSIIFNKITKMINLKDYLLILENGEIKFYNKKLSELPRIKINCNIFNVNKILNCNKLYSFDNKYITLLPLYKFLYKFEYFNKIKLFDKSSYESCDDDIYNLFNSKKVFNWILFKKQEFQSDNYFVNDIINRTGIIFKNYKTLFYSAYKLSDKINDETIIPLNEYYFILTNNQSKPWLRIEGYLSRLKLIESKYKEWTTIPSWGPNSDGLIYGISTPNCTKDNYDWETYINPYELIYPPKLNKADYNIKNALYKQITIIAETLRAYKQGFK